MLLSSYRIGTHKPIVFDNVSGFFWMDRATGFRDWQLAVEMSQVAVAWAQTQDFSWERDWKNGER